jgi:hypothetical protein
MWRRPKSVVAGLMRPATVRPKGINEVFQLNHSALETATMPRLPCSRLVAECGRALTAQTSSRLRPQVLRCPP